MSMMDMKSCYRKEDPVNGIVYITEKIILKLYGQEASDIKCHGERLASCMLRRRLRLAYVFLFALSTAYYLSIHAFVQLE